MEPSEAQAPRNSHKDYPFWMRVIAYAGVGALYIGIFALVVLLIKWIAGFFL